MYIYLSACNFFCLSTLFCKMIHGTQPSRETPVL